MARNPRDVTRNAILTAMVPPEGGQPKTMSLAELETATGMDRGRVADALFNLVSGGILSWSRQGCYRWVPPEMRMPSPPPMPRRVGGDGRRARLWRALRTARKGSVSDLVRLVLRDGENLKLVQQDAARYLRDLERAGYLVDLRRPGERNARYALLRDTGPAAPSRLRGGLEIHDRNTGEVFRTDGDGDAG